MGVFADRFREVMELRRQQRQYQLMLGFAQHKAEQMLESGATASQVVTVLVEQMGMGCPCHGPRWWRQVCIDAYAEKGEALPPELAGVNG